MPLPILSSWLYTQGTATRSSLLLHSRSRPFVSEKQSVSLICTATLLHLHTHLLLVASPFRRLHPYLPSGHLCPRIPFETICCFV